MAETVGLVQRLSVMSGSGDTSWVCVHIGPTPSNAELLIGRWRAADNRNVQASTTGLVDALVTAQVGRREVTVIREAGGALITGLRIDPA